ncbi:hypothetical protein [uncultured Thalassospira sp.]|uniref:hypothetical protein n=1 Tax=uncultured Thalassospira sp. TaxID=404382 RepID=UPI002587CB43|nr:hypothetical protein [uncultured Thalassospira sp.]
MSGKWSGINSGTRQGMEIYAIRIPYGEKFASLSIKQRSQMKKANRCGWPLTFNKIA